MTRVFEALQREQERRRTTGDRDPLAAETGAPEGGSNAEAETAAAGFQFPSMIGSPVAPRANEEVVFPSANGGGEERTISEGALANRPVSKSNGRSENDFASRHRRNEFALNHRLSPQFQSGTAAAARLQAENKTEDGLQPEAQKGRQENKRQTVARAPREIPVERLTLPRVHPRLILLTEPELPECEQYRTLRTQLFHAAEKKQTQVVVVTSAIPGEGKTSTALNLALAIAQSKENRALVIDGDLRRPNVASYLGLRPRASALTGFDQVLAGGSDALGSIVCLGDQELYVLPVNREVRNPTELLSSERFAETINELREYFDFIIIDSPPVLPFADSRLLANTADAVILVVRAGSAASETVEKAIDALPPGRILGVVLNDAEHSKETDYYDYYYSYTQREQRRLTLLGRITSRIRESWLGRKMNL
jgi:capsular exopolysaccharide synthesis family protein